MFNSILIAYFVCAAGISIALNLTGQKQTIGFDENIVIDEIVFQITWPIQLLRLCLS